MPQRINQEIFHCVVVPLCEILKSLLSCCDNKSKPCFLFYKTKFEKMRKDKLLLPLFILLIIPFLSFSQEETLPKLEAYFSAMIIEDMDTSIEWYSKLGFDVLNNIGLF